MKIKFSFCAILSLLMIGSSEPLGAAPFAPLDMTLLHYGFNETAGGATTANDQSGNGYHATYGSNTGRGDAHPSLSGLGNAVSLSTGTAGRVAYTDPTPYAASSLYTLPQKSFTIDFYLKLNEGMVDANGKLTFNQAALLVIQGSTSNSTFDLKLTLWGTYSSAYNGGFSIGDSTGAAKVSFLGGASYLNLLWEAEEWYHIAFSFDVEDGKYRFYRSAPGETALGEALGTSGNVGPLIPSSQTATRMLTIGSQGATSSSLEFQGMMDEVRITVPEPGSQGLVLLTLGALGGWRRLQKKKCQNAKI